MSRRKLRFRSCSREILARARRGQIRTPFTSSLWPCPARAARQPGGPPRRSLQRARHPSNRQPSLQRSVRRRLHLHLRPLHRRRLRPHPRARLGRPPRASRNRVLNDLRAAAGSGRARLVIVSSSFYIPVRQLRLSGHCRYGAGKQWWVCRASTLRPIARKRCRD